MVRDLEDKAQMRGERDVPLLVNPQLLDSPHRAPIRKVRWPQVSVWCRGTGDTHVHACRSS